MDAIPWYLLMYIGPAVSCVAPIGIAIRAFQFVNGDLKLRFMRLAPWAKVIVGIGGVSAVVVVAALGGAVFELYSALTCSSGGGCAQWQFAVAFSAGVFGLSYLVFELLLLPLTLPAGKASHA